jgi:hypothetical protein
MNTDLNNEEYPRLVPPEVVYERKASLKKPVVIPLYAKIISAAAAVALLFGIFWNRSVMPEQELMAELKPIEATGIKTDENAVLAKSQARFIVPKKAPKRPLEKEEVTVVYEKVEMPMLAELQPKAASLLVNDEYHPGNLLAGEIYFANNETSLINEFTPFDDSDLSLIGRGIYKMTDGEHDSFAGVFSEGLQSVKNEMALLATTIQSSRYQLRQMVR